LVTKQNLTERGCLRCHAMPPTFLIWHNLCDLVYQPFTKTYRSLTAVAFGIQVTWLPCLPIEHLPDTSIC